MANFKRRRPRGRHACWLCNPHKVRQAPPWWRLSGTELRRIGGRKRRIRRHDTGWAFDDER